MKQIKIILLAFIVLILASCNNSGSSSSGSNIGSNAKFSVPANFSKLSSEQLGAPDSPTSLGDLPNGSQIIIAEPTYIEPQDGTFITSLSLTSNGVGEDATSYTVSFSTTPINNPQDKKLMALYNAELLPSVTADDNCVLTGNKDCDLTLVSNNAPIGTYEITPVFTNKDTGKVTYGNSFTYDVRHDDDPGCHHDDGKLAVKLNSTNISNIGETIYGTISLTDVRYDKTDNVEIEIYPTNPSESGVAKVTPQTCTVSAKKNCTIGITGLSAGTTSFTIKAVDSKYEYKSVTTPRITVHAPVVAGYLTLKINPNSLNYNGDAVATVTLESAQSVSNLTVNFGSENPNLVQIENSCAIENSNPGSNTCNVRIHAESATGFVSIVAYVLDSSYIPAARVVSVHPEASSGHLAITLQNDAIWYGQTTIAQIALVDSSYVTPFNVNLTSSNPNIAKLNEPTNCTLSTAQPICQVTVTAQNTTGFSDIKAVAESYDATQTTLEVYPTPILGALITMLDSETLQESGDTIAIIKLHNSENVKDITVTINSDNPDIAKPVGNNTCHLSTADDKCQVMIHSLKAGNATLITSANGYISDKTKLVVIAPGNISISTGLLNLQYGQTQNITLTLNGSSNLEHAKVTFIPSNPEIADVTACNPAELSSMVTTCTATITAGQITENTSITVKVIADGYDYPESIIQVKVTPNPLPGNLAMWPPVLSVAKNTTADETISLDSSRLVNTPIPVNVGSYNTDIASVKVQTCNLSTENHLCYATVRGVNVGSTAISAASTGYVSTQATVNVGNPPSIPQQCWNDVTGKFVTATTFDAISAYYTFSPGRFEPAPYGIPLYENGVVNIADRGFIPGWQFLSDVSSTNPVNVNTVTERVTPGSEASGSTQAHACDSGHVTSDASITSDVGLTQQGLVHLHMFNNSNGHCGGTEPQTLEMNIPLSGFDQMVYSLDDQGCGGNNWDVGGKVYVKGGCSGDSCSYAVTAVAHHGGVGGQCRQDIPQSYNLTFRRPKTYQQLSNLTNFNLQTASPSFVANAGQNDLSAWIDGQLVGTTPRKVTCSNGGCLSENPPGVWYTNNWNGQFNNMTYSIGLQPGDSFGRICTNFNSY